MIKILYKNEPYWIKFTKKFSHAFPYLESLYIKRTGFWSIFTKYKRIDSWDSKNTVILESFLEGRIEKYLETQIPSDIPRHIIKCSPEIEALYK
jgi:hypothetical protein